MKCELSDELTRHRKEDAKTLAEARREVAHLNELVAQLSGHANSKQKIQRVMKIEQDNVTLRKENLELRNKMRELQMGGAIREREARLPPQLNKTFDQDAKEAKVPVVSSKPDAAPRHKAAPQERAKTPTGELPGRLKSNKPLTQPTPPALHANSRVKKREAVGKEAGPK